MSCFPLHVFFFLSTRNLHFKTIHFNISPRRPFSITIDGWTCIKSAHHWASEAKASSAFFSFLQTGRCNVCVRRWGWAGDGNKCQEDRPWHWLASSSWLGDDDITRDFSRRRQFFYVYSHTWLRFVSSYAKCVKLRISTHWSIWISVTCRNGMVQLGNKW